MERQSEKLFTIADVLEKIEWDTLFVIPGSLLDVLLEIDTGDKKIITAYHEEQLGYMAIGYYLETKKIPVVMVSQGPGETNLITAMAAAYREQIPMLVISAYQKNNDKVYFQQSTGLFHTPNVYGIMKNITGNSIKIEKKFYEEEYREVINIIRNCKYPMYICINESKSDSYGIIEKTNSEYQTEESHIDYIQLFEKNKYAKNVGVLIGAGAEKNVCELIGLAQKYDYQLLTTLKAIDLVDTECKNYLGHIGIMGNNEANTFLAKTCEVLMVFGSSLSGNTLNGWFKEFKSRDGQLIYVNRENTLTYKLNEFHHAEIEQSKEKNLLSIRYSNKKKEKNNLVRVINKTQNITLVLEAYKKPFISALELHKTEKLMMVGGFGPLGSSISMSVGAAIGNSKRHYVVLCGDGGFLFSGMALMNVKKYQLPILILINVNYEYKTVADGQRKKVNRTIATNLELPDIKYTYDYFGIKQRYVDSVEEFEKIYSEFLDMNQPLIVFAPDSIYN